MPRIDTAVAVRNDQGDLASGVFVGHAGNFVQVWPGGGPPPAEITVLDVVGATFAASPTPVVTFDDPFVEGDVIALFSSTDTNADIWVTYDPVYATIVGGSLIKPANSSVTVACQYHVVTAAEELAETLTFGQRLYAANEAGGVHGVAMRGVDLAQPVDLFASTFGAVQPFTIPGLPDTIAAGTVVLSLLGVDLVPTLAPPTAPWEIVQATPGAVHVGNLYGLPAAAVGGVAIPDGTVDASGNDDFAALTVGFKAAA